MNCHRKMGIVFKMGISVPTTDEKAEVQGGKNHLPKITQHAYSSAGLDTSSEAQPEVWTVKINKGNLTKMGWGGWKGESYHSTPITGRVVNYPQQKSPWQEKNHQLQAPAGKRCSCISCKKSTTPASQPMRNCHHPELLLSPVDFGSK